MMDSKAHWLYVSFILSINYNPHCSFVLNKLTTSEAQKISNWTPTDKGNVWELSGQFEGDIVFDDKQKNVLSDNRSYWKDNIIPFEIDSVFDDNQKKMIEDAAKQFEMNSCFLVRPKIETDNNFVYVTGAETGCWAQLGFRGGVQYLNLQKIGCLIPGTIVHEFLHSIGFLHQHSTSNRDDHITILWENIQQDKLHNFEKSNLSYTTSFNLPYDYGSVLHYSAYAFTENGEPTIISKVENVTLGNRLKMSDIDIAKLNQLCKHPTVTEASTTNTIESTTAPNSANHIQFVNCIVIVISICMVFVNYIDFTQ